MSNNVLKKYSKSIGEVESYYKSLVKMNDKNLARDVKVREKYMAMPVRCSCKLCDSNNKIRYRFNVHGICYWMCDVCGHVNGEYQDTADYCKSLYEGDWDYGEDYNDINVEEYNRRVKNIYAPKADFMIESLRIGGAQRDAVSVLDVGAGTGHFVKALEEKRIKSVGVEVDAKQVERAKKFLERNIMEHVPSDSIVERIKRAEDNVISFIYCLEHVVNLNDILDAVAENPNIRYLFFSVPMFSFSFAIGSLNDGVSDRLLGGGEHTHLFSRESVDWLCNKYNYNVIGEWHFGADMADLMRTMYLILQQDDNIALSNYIMDNFMVIIDELQEVIDRHEMCSDLHMVLKKR